MPSVGQEPPKGSALFLGLRCDFLRTTSFLARVVLFLRKHERSSLLLPSFRQRARCCCCLHAVPQSNAAFCGKPRQALGMEGASTIHKEEDDGQAPRLLDAPVKIQDQEGNDQEGLDFMWGTDKV